MAKIRTSFCPVWNRSGLTLRSVGSNGILLPVLCVQEWCVAHRRVRRVHLLLLREVLGWYIFGHSGCSIESCAYGRCWLCWFSPHVYRTRVTEAHEKKKKKKKHESEVTLTWATRDLSLSNEAKTSNFHQRKSSFLQYELLDDFLLVLASARTTGKRKEENEDEKMKNGKTKEMQKLEQQKKKKKKEEQQEKQKNMNKEKRKKKQET